MQLRVIFREEHETGESRTGFSTSLRERGSDPVRETVAFGVLAVNQFREEVERGIRGERSFLCGRVESPSMETLLREFESPHQLQPPRVRLHQPHHISQSLWPVRDLLDSDSQDVVSRVRIEPTNDKEFFHSHEHSDRLVLITKGSGSLHVCPGETKYFPRDLTKRDLGPGDVVFLARGVNHHFCAGPDGTEALVWHCPYIDHGNPEYQTEMQATQMAMLLPLKAVLRDRALVTILYAVHLGYTETTALCEAMHVDRGALEPELERLETLKMLQRDGESAWSLHPTFRIEEADGRLHLIRDQDGTVAKVSAPIRK